MKQAIGAAWVAMLWAGCSGGGAIDAGTGGGSATGGGMGTGGGTGAGFAIATSSPADQATLVALSTPISVSFTAPASTASLSLSPAVAIASQNLDDSKQTLEVNLGDPLVPNTQYTATVTAKDTAGAALTGATTFKFTTAPLIVDTTPPTLTGTSPMAGATNVAASARVSLTFSEPIDPDSIVLTASPNYDFGQPAMSNSFTVATFSMPAADFPSGIAFLVQVAAADLAGNLLSGSATFSFTTAAPNDTTAPVVVSTQPSAGATAVSTSVLPSVTFSEPVEPASTALMTLNGGPCNATLDSSGTTMTCNHSAMPNLTANTMYTVALTTGVKDLAGNALGAPFSFSFTTGSTVDMTPPSVVSSTPADGGFVRQCAPLTVTFSENMDKASVQAALSFTQNDGGKTIVWPADGGSSTMTARGSANWNPGTTVGWALSTAAKDTSNLALAPAVSRTFRVLKEINIVANGAAEDGYASGVIDGGTQNVVTTSALIGVGETGTNTQYRGFFAFDLSAIPAGSELRSATLNAYQSSVAGQPYAPDGGVGPMILERMSYVPPISGAAFRGAKAASPEYCGVCSCIKLPNLPGTISEPRLSTSAALGWKAVSVLDEAQAGFNENRFLRLRARSFKANDGDGTADLATFFSSESTSAANGCVPGPGRLDCKPYLNVTYYAP